MEKQSGKKVLLRGMKLSGGSPKSAYQYMKLLKADGYSVTAIMQETEPEMKALYESEFDKLKIMPDIVTQFRNRAFFTLCRQLYREYRELKEDRPDLVFALGYGPAYFYGHFCSRLKIPCVFFIAGGDLSANELCLKGGRWSHTICFSEENRDVLLKYFDDKNISVIPNRIALKSRFDDLQTHYRSLDGRVRILLTSRISDDKYASVISFTKSLKNIADENRRITLAVAGGGNRLEEFAEYAKAIDNPFLEIEVKGHLADLMPEFKKAHIVAGKGRSVIEPVMMNRIGCVIGDDGKIEFISNENFDRIYHYNFSGRHLSGDAPQESLKAQIDTLLNNEAHLQEITQTAQLVGQYYSAEYLREKFYAVLDSLEIKPQKKVPVPIFVRLMSFALVRMRQKITKLMKK